MKRIFPIIVTMSALSIPAMGQTLKGHVYDATTNQPLPGVSITYKSKGHAGVISDANGAYSISLPAGGSDLVFSYVGYEDVLEPVVIDKRETVTKDIYMKVKTHFLQDVVVSAGRFAQKLSDVTVSMDLVKAGDIANQAPTDLSATLKNVPGVDIVDKQPSIRGGGGWTYGVGSRAQVLVDGLSTLDPQTGQINWNTVPTENIEQVEIIKGASSVLYGSSALNGIVNVRTARPGLVPQTHISTYVGIYNNYSNSDYRYSNNRFWENNKYAVQPLLRSSLYSGIRNPIYEGWDFSHQRRIGNFDVAGGLNLYNDEGYREQGFNKRFRFGGTVTYHRPEKDGVYLNVGTGLNFMSDKYGDFIVWRSPEEPLRPSPYTNMAREENQIHVSPFFNYNDTKRGITHKIRSNFYFGNSDIYNPTAQPSLTDIFGNMGTDAKAIQNLITQIKGGDYSALSPIITPLMQGGLNDILKGLQTGDWSLTDPKLNDVLNGGITVLKNIFPNAKISDMNDLIAWTMRHGLPKDIGAVLKGQLPSDLIPWLSNAINPEKDQTINYPLDKVTNFYVDYQFGKQWSNGVHITAGATLNHIRFLSGAMKYAHDTQGKTNLDYLHKSDNASLYFQYDQRFFDRLSVSAGLRAEYYRVDDHYRESETKVFGKNIPVRPVFRAGLNYQLDDMSYLRASFGQGYRYPSLTEKYLLKDIGGIAVYPNKDLKAESGYNAEIGFKQGYKIGRFQGYFDVAGFYTEYKNMIEFNIGFFNTDTYAYINGVADALLPLLSGQVGLGARFSNVTKAQIYGAEVSTYGTWSINKNTNLTYNIGYTYTEPRDANYKETNAYEAQQTDALYMRTKSNDSKYLKYRPRHTFKGVFDFQWKRITVGGNVNWRSKIEAIDYVFQDERPKSNPNNFNLMQVIRNIVLGTGFDDYWKKTNTDICTVDLRAGVKVTKEVAFQFQVNNVFNKEYSNRPMCLEAPRTVVAKLDVRF